MGTSVGRRFAALVFCYVFVSGCNGGASQGAPVPLLSGAPHASAMPSASAVPSAPGSTATPSAASTTSPTPLPTATATATATALPAGEKVYVVNHGPVGVNPSIAIFADNGGTIGTTPLATISGPNTLIAQPFFDAVDAKGTLYVSNQSNAPTGSAAGYITEYDAGSQSGNVAPSRTITGLDDPEGVAIDSKGNLYVAETEAIAVFAPGASGNATPIRTIAGANTDFDVLTFNGQVHGLAMDASDDVYAALAESVVEFASGASGNATPANVYGDTAQGELYGSATLASCLGTAVDTLDNVYCANFNNDTFAYFATALSPGTLVTSTAAKQPFGIFVDSSGAIFVTNYNGSSLLEFSSLATFLTGLPTQTISGGASSISYPYGVTAR